MKRFRRRAGPLRVDRWIGIIVGADGCAFALLTVTSSSLWTFIVVTVLSAVLVVALLVFGEDSGDERGGVDQEVTLIESGGEVVGAVDVQADVTQRVGTVKGSLLGLRGTPKDGASGTAATPSDRQ